MTTTFYNDAETWKAFCNKVEKENPTKHPSGRLIRTPSEVLRDLQTLYAEHGETLLKRTK